MYAKTTPTTIGIVLNRFLDKAENPTTVNIAPVTSPLEEL